MSGLKSGAGDDLWGDENDEDDDPPEAEQEVEDSEAEATTASDTHSAPTTSTESTESDRDTSTEPTSERDQQRRSQSQQQPYIVRRAVKDKSVQFERDTRLTFFVHEDVAEGERDLKSELEGTLGRDVPKFDIREAVYRAALRNREDVLEELLEMGYDLDEGD